VLHAAAKSGHQQCVVLLLQLQSDPSLKDKDGNSPLDLAAENGHMEITRTLLLLLLLE
jgi:ankyrin repeat protein